MSRPGRNDACPCGSGAEGRVVTRARALPRRLRPRRSPITARTIAATATVPWSAALPLVMRDHTARHQARDVSGEIGCRCCHGVCASSAQPETLRPHRNHAVRDHDIGCGVSVAPTIDDLATRRRDHESVRRQARYGVGRVHPRKRVQLMVGRPEGADAGRHARDGRPSAIDATTRCWAISWLPALSVEKNASAVSPSRVITTCARSPTSVNPPVCAPVNAKVRSRTPLPPGLSTA